MIKIKGLAIATLFPLLSSAQVIAFTVYSCLILMCRFIVLVDTAGVGCDGKNPRPC